MAWYHTKKGITVLISGDALNAFGWEWGAFLIAEYKIQNIHPAEQTVENGPAHRVPSGIADDHGQGTAEGDAGFDGFRHNSGMILFVHNNAPFSSSSLYYVMPQIDLHDTIRYNPQFSALRMGVAA